MSEPANEFEGFAFAQGGLLRDATGGEGLGSGLRRAVDDILAAATHGLEKAAKEVVLDEAVKQAPELMPESMKRAGEVGGDQGGLPGELKESGKVDMVHEGTAGAAAAISFNTIYASLQHERLDWHHESGNAKYLENAMNTTREEVVTTIAAEIRKVTGGD